jgi:signal transduction histidine kinase
VLDAQGAVVAVVGLDTSAEEHWLAAAAYALLPLFAMLALLIIVHTYQRDRLRQLQYIQEKGDFLSIASHEIRTPLTGISWASEILLNNEEIKTHPEAHAMLSLIHSNCQKLLARINSLLNVAGIESGKRRIKPERVVMHPFLTEIVESLVLSAKERSVDIVIDNSLTQDVVVMCDRETTYHIFFNLLSNAVKYTNTGTKVVMSYKKNSAYHEFTIADNGAGILLEDQKLIFAGYHRTEQAIRSGQPGTGMGLYLTRHAARLQGGDVAVSSELGKGSLFTVRLPL